MGLFSAFLALCFLIFFHELGHFCAARIMGVKVEVFSIGFGKKILHKTIGGTQYALSLIPLGGYVKLKGQDDLDPLKRDIADDSYSSKSPWAKIIILSAGVAFNLLLAFLLYIAVASAGIKVLLPVVGSVQEGSPAQRAGILPGDHIVGARVIDSGDSSLGVLDFASPGEPASLIEILSWQDLSDIISQTPQLDSSPGSGELFAPLAFAIMRTTGDKTTKLTLILRPESSSHQNLFGEMIRQPMIGISAQGAVGEMQLNFTRAVKFAYKELLRSSLLIFESLKKLILGVIPLDQVGGVVGIVDVMAEVAPSGFSAFAMLVALISVNLAVINLLPIPALDGGQILFVCHEALMRKPMSDRVLYALTLLGWTLLLGLMVLGVYNDVLRIVTRSF